MTTPWTYLRSEPALWTVGFHDPNGTWHPDSDHGSDEAAAQRVHWLNGGSVPEQETRPEYTERTARFWIREAFRLAARDGWSAFDTHPDPVVAGALEFDGSDECGLPLWERPADPSPTRAQDGDR
jgi:hypothetical protein